MEIKSKPYIKDLIIFLFLLLAGLKFTYGMSTYFDIGLHDESSYLFNGLGLLERGFPSVTYAPLYALWYFILSLFTSSKTYLYYLNYVVLTILPALLMYILLRRKQVAIPISLLISWLILLSRGNAYGWPKINHFALILILGILIITSRMTLLWASAWGAIGLLLVSYARPEYFLSFILFLVLFLILYIREGRTKIHPLIVTGCILIGAVILITIGLPLSGNRTLVAFGQHFTGNWVEWTGSDINPWSNWKTILAQNFGDSNTLLEAVLYDPRLFLKHITYNMLNFSLTISTIVFPNFMPIGTITKLCALLLLGFLLFVNFRKIKTNFKDHLPLVISTVIIIIPGLMSSIIFAPRKHYLIILSTTLIALITILISSKSDEEGGLDYQALLLIGLLTLTVTPYVAGSHRAKKPQPILRTILFIESLQITDQVHMLEVEGGYDYYLDENYSRVFKEVRTTGFFEYMQDEEINMIILTDALEADTRFRDDPEWEEFLDNFSDYGYEKRDVPQTGRQILIHEDLLD